MSRSHARHRQRTGPNYPRPAVQVPVQGAVPGATPAREVYGAAAAPAGDGDEEVSFARTLQQYVHIALKRKWLILSVMLGLGALGALKAVLATPRYTATVRVQIDREPMKVLDRGVTAPQEDGGIDFLRTQFELLKSRAMAERVASMLKLKDDRDFIGGTHSSGIGAIAQLITGPRPKPSVLDAEAVAVGLVGANVDVRPVSGSRLVDVSFTDPSPVRAQKIANGFGDAYMASNVDKRFKANAYAKNFLDDQIQQLKLRMEESEQAGLEFAEREKIVEVNDKASVAENNLSQANVALGQLISERIKAEQQWRQVESSAATHLSQFLTNKVVDELRTHKKSLETEYQEKLEAFKPSYPAMVQISSKIKETDKQIAAEVNAIRNSLKGAYEAALTQENEMKKHVEELREEVLDLQKKGIQYNILKREVETNRGLYNSLLQRYKEVDIASGSGTTNIFIADPAVLPVQPSEPNIPRVVFLSLVLGLACGGGLAYLLEILDDRVRAPEELEQLSGIAALGVIPAVDASMEEALRDPRSYLSEAHRSLGTALQFSTEAGLPRSVSITSSGPGEGKSTTSVMIARHFASLGLKVLLVDGDLRKPSLHIKLRLDNTCGLSNYLTGNGVPPDLVQKTDNPNLAFMASGPLPPNAADLLGGNRIFSLVTLGSEVFDLIVVDCPPLMGLADAQLLASATAATVFVVGAGEQRESSIRAALRRLAIARIAVVGAVLTKFDAKAVSYGYGYVMDTAMDMDTDMGTAARTTARRTWRR